MVRMIYGERSNSTMPPQQQNEHELVTSEVIRLGMVQQEFANQIAQVGVHLQVMDKLIESLLPKGKTFEAEWNRHHAALFPQPESTIPDNVVTLEQFQSVIQSVENQFNDRFVQLATTLNRIMEVVQEDREDQKQPPASGALEPPAPTPTSPAQEFDDAEQPSHVQPRTPKPQPQSKPSGGNQ